MEIKQNRANNPIPEKITNYEPNTKHRKIGLPKHVNDPGSVSRTLHWTMECSELIQQSRPGAAEMIVDELKMYNLLITAIQEVRWPKGGETVIDGYSLFYTGRNDKHGTAGIRFIVNPATRNQVKS